VSPSLQRLSAEAVHATVAQLSRRIAARFPERRLVRVATELEQLAGRRRRTAATRGGSASSGRSRGSSSRSS
jgi:hypothetical protein